MTTQEIARRLGVREATVRNWIANGITVVFDDSAVGREALVQIVNILGAPRSCPCNKCEGCKYEREEAIREGLIALGYLEEVQYDLADAGPPTHFVAREPVPDALDAWERFMKAEFNVELKEGWREHG
jgi:hypothetical protein